ncbi:hypothetical protein BDD14_5700 [Edaphobacter modestus]|uniref:Uncharacterized protein n=1 Tax=Edaphobacter modestus TaxID=388466 RepID=A0A4Q7YE66_9BACT|nr:hypothetical protein BDD14_5700 [Edaphobacter modestus]
MRLHAKIDVRRLVIGCSNHRSTAYGANLVPFLFPDDDAATGNVALIGYGSDFINGQ